MDRQLIERFAAGAEMPGKAIKGLSAKELNWKPTDKSLGAWTIQQLIVHLMESHMIAADRMRRIRVRRDLRENARVLTILLVPRGGTASGPAPRAPSLMP